MERHGSFIDQEIERVRVRAGHAASSESCLPIGVTFARDRADRPHTSSRPRHTRPSPSGTTSPRSPLAPRTAPPFAEPREVQRRAGPWTVMWPVELVPLLPPKSWTR